MEIRSLVICIDIKAFNWFNRKQLNILKNNWKYFWIIWKIILLLTKDDLTLKVTWEITFRGLVSHKPVDFQNKKVY